MKKCSVSSSNNKQRSVKKFPPLQILQDIVHSVAFTLLYQDVFARIVKVILKQDDTKSTSLEDKDRFISHFFHLDGICSFIPIPEQARRCIIEQLNVPELSPYWKDTLTLGWIYQFWNETSKKRIDDKVLKGGKVDNNEIASKTQLFTEQYMIDWTLQNTLGRKWFSICQRNNWTPEVISNGTLQKLQHNQNKWRERRQSGEIPLGEFHAHK